MKLDPKLIDQWHNDCPSPLTIGAAYYIAQRAYEYGLEQAAKVCDVHAEGWEKNPGQNPHAGVIASSNCAAFIRTLKGTK